MISMEMLQDARRVLSPVINQTPVLHAPGLVPDCDFYLKADCLQKTGAFKLRGAYYKIATLSDEEKRRGVIACSAGNHAQGVGFASRDMHIPATICIPAGAPISKIEATRSYGANVVLVPGVYDDAHDEAVRLCEEQHLTFIHPFDDYQVMAGQGTIGLKPDCRIIGVQAEGAPSMAESLRQNRIITLPRASTIADGIQVKTPGELTYQMCRDYVDEVVTVSESEIASAIVAIMERQKLVAEGAGAVATAAAMFGKIDVKGHKVCALLSAGNVDVTTLERVISRGMAHSGRLAGFTTVLPDHPGALADFLRAVADTGVNVLEIHHQRGALDTAVTSCFVHIRVETRNAAHIEELYAHLREKGFTITDQSL